MIQINNYTKVIKKRTILDNVSYKFEGGKIYGLHGRNGCGKTMLLRAIAGLIYATEGEIISNNKRLHKDMDFLPDTGIIIENLSMLPQFTGFQNLKILAKIKKKATDDDIEEALQRVELDPRDHRKVKEYSLGMKQRLSIAQAIFEKPSILLLDEPSNALDSKSVEGLHELLQSEKKRGTLVILASHNKEDVFMLCDEVIEMENGKIVNNNLQ